MATLTKCVSSVRRIAAHNQKRSLNQNNPSSEMFFSFPSVKITGSHTSKEDDTRRNGRESADSTPKEISHVQEWENILVASTISSADVGNKKQAVVSCMAMRQRAQDRKVPWKDCPAICKCNVCHSCEASKAAAASMAEVQTQKHFIVPCCVSCRAVLEIISKAAPQAEFIAYGSSKV